MRGALDVYLTGFRAEASEQMQVPLLMNIATCHLELGEHELAVDACTAALARQPGSPEVYARRGLAHLANGNAAAAVEDLERAVELGAADAAETLDAARLELEAPDSTNFWVPRGRDLR